MDHLGAAFVYGGNRGRYLSFMRVHPSQCEVKCGRQHDHDNMYAYVGVDGTVWLKCRRDPSRSKRLGQTMTERMAQANGHRDSQVIDRLCEIADSSTVIENLPPFSHLLGQHDTCCIRAGMGIGKTNELIRVLNTLPANATVVLVSFRRSFTAEMMRRFSVLGFTSSHEHPRAA